jgi:ribonuclease D
MDTVTIRSMKNRYDPESKSISDLEEFKMRLGLPARPAADTLELRHFGCTAVVVNSDVTATECTSFIRAHSTLSMDTEDIQPKHPDEEGGCALFQIGTTDRVYLIQVSDQLSEPFRSELAGALVGKTLVHWGGSDEQKLRRVLPLQHGTFQTYDIQKQSYDWHGNNLSDCMDRLTPGNRLDKTWTMSGWDINPLLPQQIEYAALDVVCCHALYRTAHDKCELVFDKSGDVYRWRS